MTKIKLITGAISLLLFANCENNQKENEEITKKIDALYEKQISFYDMELDSTLFSKELIENMYDIKNITKIDKANMIGGSDSLEFQAAQESEDVARRAFETGGSKIGLLAGVGAYRGESATGDLVFALHNQRNGYGGE
jgi:hypothetical protein